MGYAHFQHRVVGLKVGPGVLPPAQAGLSWWPLQGCLTVQLRRSGGKVPVVRLFRSCGLPKLEKTAVHPCPVGSLSTLALYH